MMKMPARIAIIVAIVILVAVAFAAKRPREDTGQPVPAVTMEPAAPIEVAPVEATSPPAIMPDLASTDSMLTGPVAQLIDLGSVGCIPCQMMAPILEELKKEYEGRLSVTFIDVRQMPQMAQVYSIQVIPTQIFLDSEGKELFRHEGFMSKEDILAKWKELGIAL